MIAEYIRDITGADLFKVKGVEGYSSDYRTCIEEAKQRQTRDVYTIRKIRLYRKNSKSIYN